jgi:hypothetical protein
MLGLFYKLEIRGQAQASKWFHEFALSKHVVQIYSPDVRRVKSSTDSSIFREFTASFNTGEYFHVTTRRASRTIGSPV